VWGEVFLFLGVVVLGEGGGVFLGVCFLGGGLFFFVGVGGGVFLFFLGGVCFF